MSFRYDGIGDAGTLVLSGIDLTINAGEFIAIVGPSGSGKTTLIQHFTGLLKPTTGSVYVDEIDIWSKGYNTTELRRKIGLVFQFPETQLFEESVATDVAFGPKNLNVSKDEIVERVGKALGSVGLDQKEFGSRSPYRLSDGEKRRVAIAGVLAMEPEFLVLDEPTAGLDSRSIKIIERLLIELNRHARTIVVVTHNMDFVLRCADRVVVLAGGKIHFDGTPTQLFCKSEVLRAVNLEEPRLITALQTYTEKESMEGIDESLMSRFIIAVRKQMA